MSQFSKEFHVNIVLQGQSQRGNRWSEDERASKWVGRT